MTVADLDRLEGEVALARTRVAEDVARLRSPAAFAGFKDDIGHALSGTAQRAAADLKSRAAANPAAVLAIGAGLLWRFAHRPPIATLLVGIGVASLLRTSPSDPPSPMVTRTGEALHAVNTKAGELSEQAREALHAVNVKAGEWSEQAREATAAAADTVLETTDRISEQAAQATARVSEQAAEFATRASQSAHRVADMAEQAFPGSSSRDTLLLGVAALSIGAAALIGYRRTEA
jgi:hypothetical protein